MFKLSLIIVLITSIPACSPRFDWRDVHDGLSPYAVLMPGKPATMSREIRLGPQTVTMNMTAAQIGHVNFAVGAAKLTDAAGAQTMLVTMKQGLLLNLAGHLTHEKISAASSDGKMTLTDEFDAISSSADSSGTPVRMTGKLVGRGDWVFQVLVVGPEKEIDNDAAETFFSSFKPV